MRTLNDMLKDQMMDEEFEKEFKEMEKELDKIRANENTVSDQKLAEKCDKNL
ncbi:hypothetical protein [Eubacterium ramulus]